MPCGRSTSGDFAEAVRAACAAGDIDWPDAQALEKLHKISAGSPGRAVEFLAGGLLPLAETLDKVLKSMPRTDYGLVHSLIQSASGARNAQTFVKLCDLIEERLEGLAREALAGGPDTAKAPAGLKLGKTSASAVQKWKCLISIKEPSS